MFQSIPTLWIVMGHTHVWDGGGYIDTAIKWHSSSHSVKHTCSFTCFKTRTRWAMTPAYALSVVDWPATHHHPSGVCTRRSPAERAAVSPSHISPQQSGGTSWLPPHLECVTDWHLRERPPSKRSNVRHNKQVQRRSKLQRRRPYTDRRTDTQDTAYIGRQVNGERDDVQYHRMVSQRSNDTSKSILTVTNGVWLWWIEKYKFILIITSLQQT